MSQLNIQILHQDYVLTCPDGQEAQLQEAVERVDQQFQKMRDTSKLRSRERVGVLLAVNLAYENLELRQQLQTLQQQLAEAQGTAAVVLTDADAQRLQALEEQTLHDQALAQQLALRLDATLAQSDSVAIADTSVQSVSGPAAAVQAEPEHVPTNSAADLADPVQAVIEQTASSTVFDNNQQMELAHQASESL